MKHLKFEEKDVEWLMVYYKEFMVHLSTKESRNEIDIKKNECINTQ